MEREVTDAVVAPQAGGQACACCVDLQAQGRSAAALQQLLAPAAGRDGQAIACTLDGGTDAILARIADWHGVVSRATGRRPVKGGVTLTYDHDTHVTVELAQLAAAEYACCSFFTFGLTVGPAGVEFSITAPEDARDVVAVIFGASGTALVGAE